MEQANIGRANICPREVVCTLEIKSTQGK